MNILGHEFAKSYDEIAKIFNSIVSSFWFDLAVIIFLLIFLIKITDVIIDKIQKHWVAKADSFETRKQTVTMLSLVKNIIFTLIAILFILSLNGTRRKAIPGARVSLYGGSHEENTVCYHGPGGADGLP